MKLFNRQGWKEQLVSQSKSCLILTLRKTHPPDGRIRTRMAGREIDIRSVPCRFVMANVSSCGFLKRKPNSLDSVGMSTDTGPISRFMRHLWIILVCGPTGSGKTTTLYSALSEINAPDKHPND